METNMRQAIIPSLTKGGRYSVTVSCYNSAGAGPSSPAAYRDTPEGGETMHGNQNILWFS